MFNPGAENCGHMRLGAREEPHKASKKWKQDIYSISHDFFFQKYGDSVFS